VVRGIRLKLLAIGFAAVLALAGVVWSSAASASGVGSSTRVTHVVSSPLPRPEPGPNPQSGTSDMPSNE